MAKARKLSEGIAEQFHGPDEPLAWQRQRKIYDSLKIANRSKPLSAIWGFGLSSFFVGVGTKMLAPIWVIWPFASVFVLATIWYVYRAKHHMSVAKSLTEDGERGFREVEGLEEGHPLVFHQDQAEGE